MTTVLFIITIFIIILGFIFNKSKIFNVIQFIWIGILMAGNTGGMDFNVHEWFFYGAVENGVTIFANSWLFGLICQIFGKMGMNFIQTNLIVSVILLFLIYSIIHKNTKLCSLVTSLFMIFPLADSIIQKRNFWAMAIGTLAFLILLNNPDKKGKIKSLVLILVATQIHPTFYVYLIVWILIKLDLEKIKRIIKVLIIISFIIIPVLPNLAAIIFPASKITLYFTTLKIPLYQSVCWWILHIIYFILFNCIIKYSTVEDGKKMVFLNNLLKLNYIMLIFMCLYYYEPTFFRIYRNTLILFYIGIGICYDSQKFLTKYKFLYTMALVIFSILVFTSQFIIFGKFGFNGLIKPIFTENMLFNKL